MTVEFFQKAGFYFARTGYKIDRESLIISRYRFVLILF